MSILVIGGTGKAGRHTVTALKAKGYSDQIRIGTRSPKADNPSHVKFAWEDEKTWEPALQGVTAVLIIGPFFPNAVEAMNHLVDRALKAGVKRYVLVSGLSLARDGHYLGKVHQYLVEKVPEYVVLRPTHFMDNFIEGFYFEEMVKTGGQFSDAYGEGKCGLIAAEDIGRSAAEALTVPSDSPLLNIRDGIQLEGPEALNFREAGEIMSRVSGKNIRYNDLDLEEMRAGRDTTMIPESLFDLMDFVLEVQRSGKMAPMKDQGVKKLTGREPKNFEVWCEENKSVWDKIAA